MFKVGDIVEAFGCRGTVVDIRDDEYPVVVSFDDNTNSFTQDGRERTWHKEPSLKLIERAVEFEEVIGYVPIIKYHDGNLISCSIFETKEEALAKEKAIGYQEIKYMRKK